MDINTDKLCFGHYTGQIKQLRKMAIKKYGVEEVAMMSNIEVEQKFAEDGYVPVCISYNDGGFDTEQVIMLDSETLDKLTVLER